MMKKIFALILCLAMMLGAAAAETAAEKETIGAVDVNGSFTIKSHLPEDYRLTIVDANSSMTTARIATEDNTRPWITLNIAFNDSYTQDGKALRMNDISDEEIALIQESFTNEMTDVSFEFKETDLGTKVMITRGQLGGLNVIDLYSIYNSYEVDIVVLPGEGAETQTLPEDIVKTVLTFMSEMDFEEDAK